jgi:hypothetical protein
MASFAPTPRTAVHNQPRGPVPPCPAPPQQPPRLAVPPPCLSHCSTFSPPHPSASPSHLPTAASPPLCHLPLMVASLFTGSIIDTVSLYSLPRHPRRRRPHARRDPAVMAVPDCLPCWMEGAAEAGPSASALCPDVAALGGAVERPLDCCTIPGRPRPVSAAPETGAASGLDPDTGSALEDKATNDEEDPSAEDAITSLRRALT